jgi:hypothetical protein
MKRTVKLFKAVIIFLIILVFVVACPVNTPSDLDKYKQIGALVAAKTYVDDIYNCQNFATQFYQNCYKEKMQCRIRSGTAGGSGFSGGNHAWNSVFIDGKWVDWEPQINNIHNGHVKTYTSGSSALSMFMYSLEDVNRILYELVGRKVPSNVIDQGTIHNGLYDDGRFISYFGGFCVDDNLTSEIIYNNLNGFRTNLPENGNGGFYAIVLENIPIMLAWIYKMGNKHYAIENLETLDPVGGRYIINHNIFHDLSKIEYILIDISNVIPENIF